MHFGTGLMLKRQFLIVMVVCVLGSRMVAAAEAGHGEHEYHPNLLAVFIGVTFGRGF